MEVFSKISIGEPIVIFDPFSHTRWHPQLLSISDIPFKEPEGVQGILLAARLLLEARKLGHMLEPVLVVFRKNFGLIFEGASLLIVALDSIIENTLYSGVVFLPPTIRVEISGNGPPRV